MAWKRLISVISILIVTCTANALTRIVDIDGSGQYTSIQAAVNASSPGDIVLVYPGRYYENISIQCNSISLISLEAPTGNAAYIDSTVIDGGLISSGIRINQNIQNIGLQGFSITNSKSGLSLGESSSSTISNCYLYSNASVYGGGINAYKCTTSLHGLSIHDNYAYIMGGGMYINGYMGSVSVTFDPVNRCSIYNNTAGAGQDIVAHSINGDLSIPLQKFTVANPSSFYAAPYRAWGNEFQLHISALEADHQETNSDLYVSPSGDDSNDGLSPESALKTIRTAVYRVASDSLSQKTVHILPGTYSRTANQQVFPIPLKSWVKVLGAGIDTTQIVGEMDPAFANVGYNPLKVFASFYQNYSSLEDLSITSSGSNNSCAIWGYDESEMVLNNLRLFNLCPKDFAAIDIAYNRDCLWDKIIIEDINTVKYGLIQCAGYFSGNIKNGTFRNAISTYQSDEVSARALVWISLGDYVFVENTGFTNLSMLDDDSQAIQFGGISDLIEAPHYVLSNCLFSNIRCNVRGMLLLGYNDPVMEITNCTFARQTGNGEALMVNGNVTISNSIFYNDRSVEIAINPMDGSGMTSTLTLNNNLIRNGFSDIWQAPGNTIHYHDTNITGNPLFLGGDDIHDPLYYSLSAGSPCINSGTPDTTGLDLLPYDLAGNWRVWNGRIDMGCYEYGSTPWVGIDDPIIPEAEPGLTLSNYPNPFNPSTTITYQLPKSGMVKLDIYNLKGQQIRTLVEEAKAAGSHTAIWNGTDSSGRSVASGVYLYRLSMNGMIRCSKMLLMK